MERSTVTAGLCLSLMLVLPARAAAPTTDTADLLNRALAYQYQFRIGQMRVVPEYVAMVETALQADSDNDALWNAMGVAYLAQAAKALLPGGTPSEAMPAIQKGLGALEHAVELNPNHAEALVTLGAMRGMMASFGGKTEEAAKGIAAMNHAVEIAPGSVRVRLQRAFAGLIFPPALRNHTAEAEDLDFLVTHAGGTQPGEFVRIMRADLFFELGQSEPARQQYEIAAASNTAAAPVAATRLEALKGSGVAAADIRKLRQSAGSQCVMCHGGSWDTQ